MSMTTFKSRPRENTDMWPSRKDSLEYGQAGAARKLRETLKVIGATEGEWEASLNVSLSVKVTEFIQKLPKWFLISLGFGIVAFVGLINHLNGPELSSWIFYLVPIFLMTWFTATWAGVIVSIASAFTWVIADFTSGADAFHSAVLYWNGVARLCSFLIFTFILSSIRSLLERERALSRIDFLTGIGNRRYFIELADMEINRARRYRHPFTIVFIDLDNFKAVNDRYGHRAGDKLLRLIADTIQSKIRITDAVARLGGDEFAILLPETGSELAQAIAGKLQKLSMEVMHQQRWPVTFSMGAMTFTTPPLTIDEMLQVSDRLMYVAKSKGKNRIEYEVFEGEGCSLPTTA